MAKFKMTSKRLYWWPVVVTFPDPDPSRAGQVIKQEFKMRFEEKPLDEMRKLQDEIAALPFSEREKREHDLLIMVSHEWDESVVDDADKPIPFTAETMREAMQSNYFRLAVYGAYNHSLTGSEARKGN